MLSPRCFCWKEILKKGFQIFSNLTLVHVLSLNLLTHRYGSGTNICSTGELANTNMALGSRHILLLSLLTHLYCSGTHMGSIGKIAYTYQYSSGTHICSTAKLANSSIQFWDSYVLLLNLVTHISTVLGLTCSTAQLTKTYQYSSGTNICATAKLGNTFNTILGLIRVLLLNLPIHSIQFWDQFMF